MASYPSALPLGLKAGRSHQLVSPLLRSELASGRARQRRKFRSVPEMVSISWLFNDLESVAFTAWFRDQLFDGSIWFDMPLRTPEGLKTYKARFTGPYAGPVFAGPSLWSFSAQLELFERSVPGGNFGLLPDYIVHADIFDIAINVRWPAA